MEQRLYYEQCGFEILPAWELATKGPGYERVMGIRNGEYVIAERRRAFALVCSHIITDFTGVAGSCDYCRALAEEANLPFPGWASQVCRECRLERCRVCLRKCCRDHRRELEREWYCSSCVGWICEEMKRGADKRRLAEDIARRGRLRVHGERFVKSLFFHRNGEEK